MRGRLELGSQFYMMRLGGLPDLLFLVVAQALPVPSAPQILEVGPLLQDAARCLTSIISVFHRLFVWSVSYFATFCYQ